MTVWLAASLPMAPGYGSHEEFTSLICPRDMLSSPIAAYLNRLHERHQSVTEGKVADYIPELSKANPDWFGICTATRDGHFYEVGDTREPFTIQPISKAFVYGLALQDRGEKHVLARNGGAHAQRFAEHERQLKLSRYCAANTPPQHDRVTGTTLAAPRNTSSLARIRFHFERSEPIFQPSAAFVFLFCR
jgi:hypothetical protein